MAATRNRKFAFGNDEPKPLLNRKTLNFLPSTLDPRLYAFFHVKGIYRVYQKKLNKFEIALKVAKRLKV